MPTPVTILTGPIRSGKTTALAHWARGRVGVGGIVQPDGPNGRRLVDVAKGDSERLEAADARELAIAAGRYRFRAAAFAWANARLAEAARDLAIDTIVVDEIGPLELSGRGMRDGFRAALARPDGWLLVIVRDVLVADVRADFGLHAARVVRVAEFPHVGQDSTSAP